MFEFFGDFLICFGPAILGLIGFLIIVFLVLMGAFWLSEHDIGDNIFVMVIYIILSISIVVGSAMFVVYTISVL